MVLLALSAGLGPLPLLIWGVVLPRVAAAGGGGGSGGGGWW